MSSTQINIQLIVCSFQYNQKVKIDVEDPFQRQRPKVVTSNMVGRDRSTWSSTSKATGDREIRSIRSRSRAHRDEEFNDTCSANTDSEKTDSASDLEVSVYMPELSSQRGVNLAEVLQKKEEQQKTIDKLWLLIQLLMDQLKATTHQYDKGKGKA